MKIKLADATSANQAPEPTSAPGQPVRKEVDFTKQWNNGHKILDTAESGALTELLHQEEAARLRFEKYKDQMTRPRNPLMGEPSPRDYRGEIVMNPKMNMTVTNGMKLITNQEQRSSTATLRRSKPTELQGKIGVSEDLYKVLGNTCADLRPSQPEDMFMFTRHVNQDKIRRQEEKAKIGEYIAKEKAKRYQTDLAREIQYLQQQVDEKAKKLTQLQNHFNI